VQPIVLLSSPKGGCGKSSLSRNILVSAAQAGKHVVGVDLDKQGTLTTWSERRERARAAVPSLPPVPVISAELDDWREALARARASGADLIVVDTPPSVELNLNAVLSLSGAADLILVPSQTTMDDIDSTAPWMKRLLSTQAKAAFILNRANRRTRAFSTIRAKLLAVGPICPIEVGQFEEIPAAAGKGLGVLDLTRTTSGETFEALWSYVAREVGL
jgi:chromosome partitioning protein